MGWVTDIQPVLTSSLENLSAPRLLTPMTPCHWETGPGGAVAAGS